MAGKTRKIELTRSVIIEGHGHCDVGDEFEIASHVAHHLVGADCAKYVDLDKEKHPNGEGYVTRVITAEDGDPAPKKTSAAKGKGKAKDGEGE
jgi:hypothetical protein